MDLLLKIKKAIYGKKTLSECVVYTIVFLIFAAFSLSYLYVLVWCFVSGARNSDAVLFEPFERIFSGLNFSNYKNIISAFKVNNTKFLGMFFNSVYFSVFGCALTILSTSTLAYATTKFKFPGSNLIYYIVLFTMMLPLYGSSGSLYRLYDSMGLLNSPLMILTSLGGMGGNYLYFHAFYKNLSSTYMEAAEIDGANDWQIFFKIIFPQSMGITGALFLSTWVVQWNAYADNLVYLPKMPTLAAGIYLFESASKRAVRWDILFGACFLVSIPPIVLFIMFNKVLTSNVSLGGIKE